MGEAVLKAALGHNGFEVTSAGTGAPEGADVEAESAKALAEQGLSLPGHRAHKLAVEDIERADLIIGMSRRHRAAVVELLPKAAARTFTARELGRFAERVPAPDPEMSAKERLETVLVATQRDRGIVRGASRREDDIRDPLGRAPEVFPATLAAITETLAPTITALGGTPLQPAPDAETSLAYPEPALAVFRRRRKNKRRFRLGTAMVIAGLLLLVVLAYGLVLALSARSLAHKVSSVRAQIEQLRKTAVNDPAADLTPQISQIQREAASAKSSAHGPVWDIARRLPVIGSAAHTVQGSSTAVSDLARDALPQVVTAQRLVNTAKNGGVGTVKLDPLNESKQPLANASVAIGIALRQVEALPAHTSIGRVDNARSDLITTLNGLAGQLDTARDATTVLPAMLGANGPRTYFLAFQNEAESRGLGGLPGAYAIVKAENGKISFVEFGNDSDMGSFPTSVVNLGDSFTNQFGATAAKSFINSNLSPNFPDAAQIWIAMWKAKTGQQLDGALIADPQVLADLLRIAGPSKLPDGTVVSADNVVSLTENDVYFRYPDTSDTSARKAFFIAVAKTVSDDVLAKSSGKEVPYAHALAALAGQRRLLVYSSHPDEQAVLARQPIAGLIPQTDQPFSFVTVSAAAGQKLDYYLDRSMTYTAGSCAGTTRRSHIDFTIKNTAPATGLPPYITLTVGNALAAEPVGTQRLLVTLYGTVGADIKRAQLDGKPAEVIPGDYLGHGTLTFFVNIRPGESHTFSLDLTEPTSSGPAIVPVQPLVRPQQTKVSVPAC